MAKAVSPVRIAALVVAVLALLLHVIGFATDYWISLDVSQNIRSSSSSSIFFHNNPNRISFPNIKASWGLWKICTSYSGVTACQTRDEAVGAALSLAGLGNINYVDDRFRAIQALETIGLIFLVLVSVGLAISLCSDGVRTTCISNFMGFGVVLAGVCILVGVGLMGQGYVLPPLTNISWSLGLSTAGGVLAIMTGALACVTPSRKDAL